MIAPALFSSTKQDWQTPRDLFELIQEGAGEFHIDAAAHASNKQCEMYYGPGSPWLEDALSQDWDPTKRYWLNPPYDSIEDWVDHCLMQAARGCEIYFLVPSRTDTQWFHKLFNPNSVSHIWFLKGRVKFEGGNSCAPFPSMLVCFGLRAQDEVKVLPWDWKREALPYD